MYTQLDIMYRAHGPHPNMYVQTLCHVYIQGGSTCAEFQQHPCAANYRRHEKAKWNMYEEWIREVEHASFTPVVFTTSGRASPLTSTFLKHLASRLAEKQDMAYSTTIGWLRARLNFSLLRSAVMCIQVIVRQDRQQAAHSMTALLMSLLWSPDSRWTKHYSHLANHHNTFTPPPNVQTKCYYYCMYVAQYIVFVIINLK